MISDGTEADIEASTPIQDGWGITAPPEGSNVNPDNVKSLDLIPWMGYSITKCHYMLKQDALEFMNDHELGR